MPQQRSFVNHQIKHASYYINSCDWQNEFQDRWKSVLYSFLKITEDHASEVSISHISPRLFLLHSYFFIIMITIHTSRQQACTQCVWD